MSPATLPARYIITAYAGDAYSKQFRFWFRSSDGSLALLDTNAWTGRMMVKENKNDTTALLNSGPTTNEVKTVTITGSPTGGSFTLSFGGQTTGAIAYNATASAVRTTLEALSTIGVGNVATTGGPLPGTAVTVTFQGSLGGRDIGPLGATSSLTGGTSPAVAIATTTQGAYGDILVTTGIKGATPDQWNLDIFIPDDRMARPALRGLVGWFDTELTDASGRRKTYLAGPFLVEGDITV